MNRRRDSFPLSSMKQVEDPRGSKSEHKDQEGRQKGNVSLLKEDFLSVANLWIAKLRL